MLLKINHLYCDKFLIGIWKVDETKSEPTKEITSDEAKELIKFLVESGASHYETLREDSYELHINNREMKQYIFYK